MTGTTYATKSMMGQPHKIGVVRSSPMSARKIIFEALRCFFFFFFDWRVLLADVSCHPEEQGGRGCRSRHQYPTPTAFSVFEDLSFFGCLENDHASTKG